MLFCMAPVAEALKVGKRVVHVVSVFMVNLASARLSAAFARALRQQTFRRVGRSGTSMSLSSRVKALGETLAFAATVNAGWESVALSRAGMSIGRILTVRAER